jgi:hypothetical protein
MDVLIGVGAQQPRSTELRADSKKKIFQRQRAIQIDLAAVDMNSSKSTMRGHYNKQSL